MNFHSRLETPPATPAVSASVRARKRQPHIVLTARNIAHASRGARERAYLAALWMRGGLTIVEPTAVLAAHAFDVSVPTINDALDELDSIEISSAWTAMTPADRADVKANLAEIWRIVDRATAA